MEMEQDRKEEARERVEVWVVAEVVAADAVAWEVIDPVQDPVVSASVQVVVPR